MTDRPVVPDYMSRRGLAVDVVLLSSGIIFDGARRELEERI
jgi:hypothetical protein